MPTALQWLADRATNPVAILGAELNSLANNGTVLSGVVENGVTKDLYGDFYLTVKFAAAPANGMAVELYLVRSADGVTFDDTSSGPPTNGFGDIWTVRNDAAAFHTFCIPMLELPPGDFKVYLRNSAGQAMVAAGNSLKMFGYKRAVG